MKILSDIIATLNYDATVKEIRVGPFQTAVLTRNCGLASTPHNPGPHHKRNPVKEAGVLTSMDTRSLIELALSESELEATVGMAAINSLIDIDEKSFVTLNAGDLLKRKGEDKKVAVVGHFPFIPELRKICDVLWVIEKMPQEGDLPESEAGKRIPQADVVAITGTAFTNHSIEYLLTLCSAGAYVIVLGGTSPLSPVLFDYGIDAISGTVVTDPPVVMRFVSQGATYRQITGIKRVTMMKQKD